MTTPLKTELEELMEAVRIQGLRIQNLEMALVSYQTLVQSLLPPEYEYQVCDMIEDFFEASSSLGGFKTPPGHPIFIDSKKVDNATV